MTHNIIYNVFVFLCVKVQAAPAEEGGAGGAGEKPEGAAGKNGAGEPNAPSHS